MSLAADGEDGNGLQLEKLRLSFSSCFRAYSKKSILKVMFKDNVLNGLSRIPLILG